MAKGNNKFKRGCVDVLYIPAPARDDLMPKGSLPYIINKFVDGLDLESLNGQYHDDGASCYDPRCLLKIILMAYCNNVYGCRPIAELAAYDLRYAVMCEYLRPSFNTINRFRTRRLGNDGVKSVFRQLVENMGSEGLIDIEDVYIDGTTVESRASRKQLVWSQQQRAWAESNKAKIDALLEQVGIAQERDSSSCATERPHGDTFAPSDRIHVSVGESGGSASGSAAAPKSADTAPTSASAAPKSADAAPPASSSVADDTATRSVSPDEAAVQEDDGKKRRGPEVHLSREEVTRLRAAVIAAQVANGGKYGELLDRLERADRYREVDGLCAGRSGTAMTDPESVAMHPKDDVRHTGPCLPMYNTMIATSNQFIIDYGLYGLTTDTSAYPLFLPRLADDYGSKLGAATADAAFGSMVNVQLSVLAGITPYFKHTWYDKEHQPGYKPDRYQPHNFSRADNGLPICPGGKEMRHVGTEKKNVNGIEVTQEKYRCDHCAGCELRDKCLKKPADFREVTINEQWWDEIKPWLDGLLDSPEGQQRLKWRSWNVEPDFAHIKWAGRYKRFRHFKRDRCEMDFGIKALAVNLKKYFGRAQKAAEGAFFCFFRPLTSLFAPRMAA